MTTEDIAARYNRLPGFRLVSYHNVALPFWIATFDSLVKSLDERYLDSFYHSLVHSYNQSLVK